MFLQHEKIKTIDFLGIIHCLVFFLLQKKTFQSLDSGKPCLKLLST
jgi:hypothetical protein